MNFIYFEPSTEGHCTFWAQIVLKRALADPRISSTRLVASSALIERLGPIARDPELIVSTLTPQELDHLIGGSFAARGLAQWSYARRLVRDENGGTCFIPFFDHALLGACLDRRPVAGKISGIIFRAPNFFGKRLVLRDGVRALRKWVMYFFARRSALHTLFTLDETLPEGFAGRYLWRVCPLLDPTPDLSLLQNYSPRPRVDGRIGMLLFGALSRRKGVLTLLEAVPHLSEGRQAQLAIRLIGSIAKPDRETFMAALAKARILAPNLVIEMEDRFVSDAELAQEVIDARVILAPYQDHVGSSGVLFWAAAAGRPVVTQKTGLMGLQVARYQLGRAVNTVDARALAAALETDPEWSKNGALDFTKNHTPEGFAQAILDGLLKGTGK